MAIDMNISPWLKCTLLQQCDGRHGIDRVTPGLSKFRAQKVRITNAVRTGQIAPAGTAAALRGIPAVTSRLSA